MSTTVEKISSNKVKLSFDIDAAKFDEAMGQGIHQGARPGRDPPASARDTPRAR